MNTFGCFQSRYPATERSTPMAGRCWWPDLPGLMPRALTTWARTRAYYFHPHSLSQSGSWCYPANVTLPLPSSHGHRPCSLASRTSSPSELTQATGSFPCPWNTWGQGSSWPQLFSRSRGQGLARGSSQQRFQPELLLISQLGWWVLLFPVTGERTKAQRRYLTRLVS